MNNIRSNPKKKLLYIYGLASGVNKKLFKISERDNLSVQIIPYLGLRDGFKETGELIKEIHFTIHSKNERPEDERPEGMIHFTKTLKGETEVSQVIGEYKLPKHQTRNYTSVIDSPDHLFSHVASIRFSNLDNHRHNFKPSDKADRELLDDADLTTFTLIAAVFVGHKDSAFPTQSDRATIKTILTTNFKIVICYIMTVVIPVPFNNIYTSCTFPEMEKNGLAPKECLDFLEMHAEQSTQDQLYWIFIKEKTALEMEYFKNWREEDFKVYEDFLKEYHAKMQTLRYIKQANYMWY